MAVTQPKHGPWPVLCPVLVDTARVADLIHHLASLADWERRSEEHYEPEQMAVEGFIHLCTADQLAGVVQRYYRGRSDLVLLSVHPDRLGAPLVWEDSTGAGEEFPHLYGPLNLDAVALVEPFAPVP